VEAALVSEELLDRGNEEMVVNFYTTAQVNIGSKTFNLNHVRIDVGSVINLAPMSVPERIRATLEQTKDLVIMTATSNLVTINW
jgi:lipoprotein signal peptidase